MAVEKALNRELQELKEARIGVKVFNRPEDYYTGEDNIVRVQADRVRKLLARYYRSQGRNDPIRINLLKGSYVPVFKLRS
jgi:intein/homing endonuclease